MKTILTILLTFACMALVFTQEKESKIQPKEVTLGKDSQSDKYGEAPFNHENHATKMYSVDGKSVIACVECHHTDQPATALTAPAFGASIGGGGTRCSRVTQQSREAILLERLQRAGELEYRALQIVAILGKQQTACMRTLRHRQIRTCSLVRP